MCVVLSVSGLGREKGVYLFGEGDDTVAYEFGWGMMSLRHG